MCPSSNQRHAEREDTPTRLALPDNLMSRNHNKHHTEHKHSRNYRCPDGPRTLQRLAVSDAPGVRANTADNPRCCSDLLTVLAEDPDRQARANAAANDNCPEHVVDMLSQDPESKVRHGAAAGAACPASRLRQLAADLNPEVQGRAVAAMAERGV